MERFRGRPKKPSDIEVARKAGDHKYLSEKGKRGAEKANRMRAYREALNKDYEERLYTDMANTAAERNDDPDESGQTETSPDSR